MKRFLIQSSLSLSLLVTGCVSIVDGGPSWLEVETNPENVEVSLTKLHNDVTTELVTPFRVELDKGSDYQLVIDTPNYRSEQVFIDRKINGWFWGNILLGGPIGMAIDYANDNMWEHNPTLITLDLQRLSSAPDTLKLNVPVKVFYDDRPTETLFLPIVFRKKIPQHRRMVHCSADVMANLPDYPNCQ